MSLCCVSDKMELTLMIVVLIGLVGAGEGTPAEKLLKKAYDCIVNTVPFIDWDSGNDFHYDYIVNISYQWDPLNHHDYLHWWKYDGPEAWRAGCHFSDTIRQCLWPVREEKIDLGYYWNNYHAGLIELSYYYLTLCEHQTVLTDNAVCIHNRMLSDDVLRCSGVLGWMRGNIWPVINKKLSQRTRTIFVKSFANVYSAVYECIYTRGEWKRACGEMVDMTMSQIKNKYITLMKNHPQSNTQNLGGQTTGLNMCDRCREGSHFKVFEHFNYVILSLLYDLLFVNQAPELFKQCHLVEYPLNKCHTQNFWRRDLFNMFCHNVTNIIAPQLEPYLPLCDFDEWIESAERVCDMGYDRMMEIAGHIEHCTDGKDELFPCYKGLFIDVRMSWGLLTASRLWFKGFAGNIGSTYQAIYPRIKHCSKLVYDHLSNTCRHGPPVVRLIQDLRTVFMFNQHHIASMGLVWLVGHQKMITDYNQNVGRC